MKKNNKSNINKITYDLTARQKRELKRKGNENNNAEVIKEEQVVTIEKARNSKSLLTIIIAAFLAVSMIAGAIVIIVLNAETVTSDTFIEWSDSNPIATITLADENNKTVGELKMEIYMDDSPYSAMNFIYLAESGYYDGTIFHDLNRGLVWFSGYTDADNSSHKSLDKNFIQTLKGFVTNNVNVSGEKGYKLGYRLRTETTRPYKNIKGSLIMLAGYSTGYSTSVNFALSLDENAQYNFGDGNTSFTSYVSAVGKIIDDDSFALLDSIASMGTTLKGNFNTPNDYKSIKIKSIRTDFSNKRKKYLMENFEMLISGESSTGAYDTWKNVAYNSGESYHYFGA